MSRATTIFNAPVIEAPTAKNHAGFPAYSRPADEQYLQMCLTNTLGDTFYAGKAEMLAEAKVAHAAMVAQDPEFAAKAIVYARNRGFMRTQPILGLAYLAGAAPHIFRDTFPLVMRTPNDLADFTAMVQNLRTKDREFLTKRNGKLPLVLKTARTRSEGGRSIKTAAGKWLAARLSEYWAIKYGRSSSEGSASLADLIKIYHPDFGGKSNDTVAYLLGRLPKVHWNRVPQLGYFEEYKAAGTDEDKVRCITNGRLPHEVITAIGKPSKAVWNALAPQLPIFALLRNLATLERHGVLDQHRSMIEQKLTSATGLRKAKVLPYRLLEAMKHTSSSWVKDALRKGIDASMDNLPGITGKTAVLLDRSGSMDGQFSQVAALFAVGVMRQAKLNGHLLLFGNNVVKANVSAVDSVLTQADHIVNCQLGGTNTGLALQPLLNDRERVENIVLITDGQQTGGRPFAEVYAEYQMKVNREVKLFVVDVSPYKATNMGVAPNVTYMYGWSDYCLDFLAMASEGWGSMVARVRAGEIGEAKPEE